MREKLKRVEIQWIVNNKVRLNYQSKRIFDFYGKQSCNLYIFSQTIFASLLEHRVNVTTLSPIGNKKPFGTYQSLGTYQVFQKVAEQLQKRNIGDVSLSRD